MVVFVFVFVLEDSSKKLGKAVHNVCIAVCTDFEQNSCLNLDTNDLVRADS